MTDSIYATVIRKMENHLKIKISQQQLQCVKVLPKLDPKLRGNPVLSCIFQSSNLIRIFRSLYSSISCQSLAIAFN